MKTFLLSLVLLACTSVMVNAQNYKPFKLGLGLGYAAPDGGGGILFDIEPAYRLNDAIAVGFRFESAAMGRAIGDDEAEVSGHSSYTLNGQYYLSDSKFRPYVGIGFGLFSATSVSLNANSQSFNLSDETDSKFGFYPRIGFDLGHFNVNFDYNIIGETEGAYINNNGDIEVTDIKNSYFGIRVGAFIFGGEN